MSGMPVSYTHLDVYKRQIHAVRSTVRKDILRRDYSSSLCQNMVLVDLDLGDLKSEDRLNGIYWK